MAHKVKCYYCGCTFDRDILPYVAVNGRRYAHVECAKNYEDSKTQEQKDQEALDEYIKKLFNESYVNPKIKKQIKTYVDEYNYTYSGILKALIYFFEIKKNNIDKANGGIGIVPYCYNDAFNYYYNIWLNNVQNKDKIVNEYIPEVVEIHIPIPQKKIKKRPLFSFLDEEEVI